MRGVQAILSRETVTRFLRRVLTFPLDSRLNRGVPVALCCKKQTGRVQPGPFLLQAFVPDQSLLRPMTGRAPPHSSSSAGNV